MYLIWPLRMCPGLGRCCVSCRLPNCASWPLMSWTPASWPWLPASSFLSSIGQNWFISSNRLLGRTNSPETLESLHRLTEKARVWCIFLPSLGIHLTGPQRLWRHWVPFSFWMIMPHLLCPIRFFSFPSHLTVIQLICLHFHFVMNKSSIKFRRELNTLFMYVFFMIFLFIFPLCVSVSLGWKTLSISWSHVCPMTQTPWKRNSLISPPLPPNQMQHVKREEVRNVLEAVHLLLLRKNWCCTVAQLTSSPCCRCSVFGCIFLLCRIFWKLFTCFQIGDGFFHLFIGTCDSDLIHITYLLHVRLLLSLSANSSSGSINVETPTVDMIENLGMDNVYWTAAQLDMMSNYTFLTCVETLGAIPGYNADQLAVLIKKATEVQRRHWFWICLFSGHGTSLLQW